MSRKRMLPLVTESTKLRAAGKKPSLDAARARLGGRVPRGEVTSPHLQTGRVVVAGTEEGSRVAVVLFSNATEVHVLFDGARLLRLPLAAVSVRDGEPPVDLASLAADATIFGTLAEGQPIRYADTDGSFLYGKLVEKCRYGAVVVRDDGAIVAVGFRKLWPVPRSGNAE